MSRITLGIIALVLLAIGGITTWRGPSGNSAEGFAAGCIRVGLVLGALWLALPQIKAMARSVPTWMWTKVFGRGKSQVNPDSDAARPRPKRPRRRSNA